MKRVLCSKIPSPGKPARLSEEESHHLTHVLRLGEGDQVEALDGRGGAILAVLKREGVTMILEAVPGGLTASSDRTALPVVLELAILKGDAMSWALEKAVELGVKRVVPLVTDHGVVRLDRKGPEAFRERWQKIADQALKQCGRTERMEIADPVELLSLEQGFASPEIRRVWFDEVSRGESSYLMNWFGGQTAPLREIHLSVGPEGGWSERERDFLSKIAEAVSLGPLVLRGETAAVFGCSLATAYFRSLNLTITPR